MSAILHLWEATRGRAQSLNPLPHVFHNTRLDGKFLLQRLCIPSFFLYMTPKIPL